MNDLKIDSQIPKSLPETPGVYFFKNKLKEIIYIGKAKNLKSRLTSYFQINLERKTQQMVSQAVYLSYIKVESEIEALLLEASLVKQHLPQFNIELRDDKSPLYIGITYEKYSRVLLLRKTQLKEIKLQEIFGPFIHSQDVKNILRLTRKIIPFSQHKPFKRVCLYKQIGFCNPCPSEVENEKDPLKKRDLRKKYLTNIIKIKNLLKGKFKNVERILRSQMKEYSQQEMFEEAQNIFQKIKTLQEITTPLTHPEDYIENPNFIEDIYQNEMNDLKKVLAKYFHLKDLTRIECYDIAHLAGSFQTASMVVFINAEASKKDYRHFRVRSTKKASDTDSLKEVIKRRMKHFKTWGVPSLMIIDGGKPQVSAINEVLKDKKIPVIGLAKRLETIVVKKNDKFFEERAKGASLLFLQRIRDEAHRFARRYHHQLLAKNLKQD